MTLQCLQALTWSTVTAAVVSALLLASGEPGGDVTRARPGADKAVAERPAAEQRARAGPSRDDERRVARAATPPTGR